MSLLPGGEMSARPLHFIWIVDCSASYLGHVTMKGIPAIQTTVCYTQQVSRAQVKDKLKLLKG